MGKVIQDNLNPKAQLQQTAQCMITSTLHFTTAEILNITNKQDKIARFLYQAACDDVKMGGVSASVLKQ